ncbi:hypothetical protein [Jannaschia sp. W003]|uniref:hypothetical protein n=1 Tax=Jannaschia sp. W003 TaxID=2867012 RepID=UPI0021A7D06E|nr:hypothetical protein [Jannaschia sp. W003]UWQ22931.1 hypothetical protein K3554_07870 [Jannaschia sp. W003]
MEFASTDDLAARARGLGPSPAMMLLCEDAAEIEASLAHHLRAGFASVVLALPPGVEPGFALPERAHALRLERRPPELAETCVNALIAGAAPGTWLAYAYNAEFLFHPFSETRRIGEALAFCAEERRDALLAYVVDLYADGPPRETGGVDMEAPWMDETGYYALERRAEGELLDRQLDFFGGLRWRFEEHVPAARRRIDRIALFRARPGLRLLPDHRLSVEEMNTYACPWHHSMTAAVASFRAAKALASNPESREAIARFRWDGSVRFEWRAQQLMDLGLMEPGQWF